MTELTLMHPTRTLGVRETFGLDTDMQVPAFAEPLEELGSEDVLDEGAEATVLTETVGGGPAGSTGGLHCGGTEMRIQQTRIARDAVMVNPQRVVQPAAAECRVRLLQHKLCVVLIRRKSAGVRSAPAKQRPHEPFEQAHSGSST